MPRAHYLVRDPGSRVPLVALVVNVALVAFLFVQMRSTNSGMRVTLGANRAASAPASAMASIPVLRMGSDGQIALDDQPLVTPLDLEFRLAARVAQNSALIVRVHPDADAQTVTRLLEAAARAGFADVLLETSE